MAFSFKLWRSVTIIILGLIHEQFLQTNLFLSPIYEVFTKIVALMNVFFSRIYS